MAAAAASIAQPAAPAPAASAPAQPQPPQPPQQPPQPVAAQLQQTKALFETGKEQYDTEVRRAVLGYDDLSALAIAAVGAGVHGTATHVLCVGCGTGHEVLALARAAAQRAPTAPRLHVTGADPAAAMIAAARKRIATELSAAEQAHVTVLNGFVHDLIRPGTAGTGGGAAPALAAGAFDGATSLLVMHLVPDVPDVAAAMASGTTAGSGKLAYLHSITHCLKPGARLFLVDGCGETSRAAAADGVAAAPALHAQMDVWVQYVAARGAPDAMRHVLKANALNWSHIVPVARVRQLLAAAGFVDVMHVYAAFHFNGFVARYAGPSAAAAAAAAAVAGAAGAAPSNCK